MEEDEEEAEVEEEVEEEEEEPSTMPVWPVRGLAESFASPFPDWTSEDGRSQFSDETFV